MNSYGDYIQPASIPVIGKFGKIEWLSSIEFFSSISVPTLSTTVLEILTAVRPGFSSMSTILMSSINEVVRSTINGLGSLPDGNDYVSSSKLNGIVDSLSYNYSYISCTTFFDSLTNLADMKQITLNIGPMVKFLSSEGSNLSGGYVSTMNPGNYRIYKSTLSYSGNSVFQTLGDGATVRTGLLDIGGYSNKLVNTSLMRIDVNANISVNYPPASALMVASGYYTTFNANGSVVNDSNAMLLYTTDGFNWQPSASAQNVFKSIIMVAYDSVANRWSAIGSNSTDQVLGTSYDGITWFVKPVTQINTVSHIIIRQDRIFPQLFTDSPLIIIGESNPSQTGNIKYTYDYGANFTVARLPAGINWFSITSITYGGLTWIATSSQQLIYISTNNGQDWSFIPTSNYNGFTSINSMNCSSYNGSVWIISGVNKIIYSSNALNWYLATTPNVFNIFDIAWNGTLWVAVGNSLNNYFDAYILTSTDGITWTPAVLPQEVINSHVNISSVTWNPGLSMWYAVTEVAIFFSYIITSTDGINWSIQENNNFLKANRATITCIRSAIGLPNTSPKLATSFSTFLTNSSNQQALGKPVSLTFNGNKGLMTNLSFLLNSNELAPNGVYPSQLQLNHRMVNGFGSNVTLSVQIPQSGGVIATLDNTD
jgi:hypothetical protein